MATPLGLSSLFSSRIHTTTPSVFPIHRKEFNRRRIILVTAAGGGKPTILVAEKLGQAGIDLLKKHANVDCSYDLSVEELCTKISLCDALIVRSGTKVGRDVFESSRGRLKVVGRAGVGIDNVDLAAATEYGCLVVNAPTANTVAAAEHGIALLTAMARNVAQADASIKAGKWMRSKYVGVSLVGKTLAVLGFGKVGSEVARRARGLGMHVITHDPYAPADRARAIGVELVSFEVAISTADFISLHLPLTAATSKMLNDETFARMKRGVRIVNVARGGVIDEDALLRALDSGIVAQAALDVFTVEPPVKDNKLVLHESVTATPHLGASTMEAQEGVAVEIAEAVVGALRGELAATAVNAPMVPPEVLRELKPYVVLAEKLGRLAVQLVTGGSGVDAVKVTYASSRSPDDLDTRLLRAMVIKGLIEPISSVFINLVNSDYVAKQRGVKISEERMVLDGSPEDPIEYITVRIANVESRFASALSESGEIKVQGRVKQGVPSLTKVGLFGVDVSLEGSVILCRQVDQPGMIGKVGSILGDENVNVSFMSVGRIAPGKQAVMAIGVDEQPSKETLKKIGDISAIEEFVFLKL
ncbi:PREDICTED: D-3-phosphoglycerate dehydrogenase 3, chloroplastic [Brassica oleracea var. oleracea]|uniref:D-3-phosphoglycerate dehydrogenase 3, chloroplastic n=1 Tax=Brassica oleracea var. oleracea TaxID=109376 RepID=UPI0006A7162F|nr:PREDICTED: D-3-phosphoglycerate dehydrogenase 3, chloroplastic [Brassica oleracea var. oleracea]